MSGNFLHLCSSAKIGVAKCFEFRHPQKLAPQKTFKFSPQSAKICSAKINAALINSFRVTSISFECSGIQISAAWLASCEFWCFVNLPIWSSIDKYKYYRFRTIDPI